MNKIRMLFWLSLLAAMGWVAFNITSETVRVLSYYLAGEAAYFIFNKLND